MRPKTADDESGRRRQHTSQHQLKNFVLEGSTPSALPRSDCARVASIRFGRTGTAQGALAIIRFRTLLPLRTNS